MLQTHPDVAIGWQASPFTLPDAHGVRHAFDELIGENGLLVAFICNHCPYVKAIGHRLSEDARILQQEGINVVAINSNDFVAYPADSPDNMKTFAALYEFNFPYLVDEEQHVAREYDAVCTPDFFGLDRTGTLQYRGRLDNARMDNDANRTPELVNAMREVSANGTTAQKQMASMGCSIKWKKR